MSERSGLKPGQTVPGQDNTNKSDLKGGAVQK